MDTTVVGRPIAELDTPALLVDLDAMERNIATIAADVRRHGVNWRPHAKAHKCPAIAHKQLAAGAIGVTCAKLGEAEVMAAGGVGPILLTTEVVGDAKIRRLLGVARQVPIAAVHRFIPWGLLGFAINIVTGTLFILTEPDQYIYNPSFHLKLLFMTIAGANAGMFYLTSYRRAFGSTAMHRPGTRPSSKPWKAAWPPANSSLGPTFLES